MLAEHILRSGETPRMLAGLAFLTGFDLFSRPTEALDLRREDVSALQVGRYTGVAVVIAPSTRVVKQRKVAKSG